MHNSIILLIMYSVLTDTKVYTKSNTSFIHVNINNL